jgi:Histone methylation protein DOT1/Surfeit locus protein 6
MNKDYSDKEIDFSSSISTFTSADSVYPRKDQGHTVFDKTSQFVFPATQVTSENGVLDGTGPYQFPAIVQKPKRLFNNKNEEVEENFPDFYPPTPISSDYGMVNEINQYPFPVIVQKPQRLFNKREQEVEENLLDFYPPTPISTDYGMVNEINPYPLPKIVLFETAPKQNEQLFHTKRKEAHSVLHDKTIQEVFSSTSVTSDNVVVDETFPYPFQEIITFEATTNLQKRLLDTSKIRGHSVLIDKTSLNIFPPTPVTSENPFPVIVQKPKRLFNNRNEEVEEAFPEFYPPTPISSEYGMVNEINQYPLPVIVQKPKRLFNKRKREVKENLPDFYPPMPIGTRVKDDTEKLKKELAWNVAKKLKSATAWQSRTPTALKTITTTIQPNVRSVYKIIKCRTGSMGGNGCFGPIYGELTIGSMQQMINYMKVYTGLNNTSFFLDVGSGIGKPIVHVAQDPGVFISYGIECEETRWMLSICGLNGIIQAVDAQQQQQQQLPQAITTPAALTPTTTSISNNNTSPNNILPANEDDDKQRIRCNCIFVLGDIKDAETFDPFTHVYMFSIG